MSPFNYFEHTADIGVEVTADSLEGLYAEAGRALFNLIADFDQIKPAETEKVALVSADETALLIDWLNELIFLFDARGWLFSRFNVSLSRVVEPAGVHLTAVCKGEKVADHRIKIGIKSATYHQASVTHDVDWRARFILDV